MVVVEVLINFGDVFHNGDVEFSEAICGTHARKHEQLRAIDGVCGNYDLLSVDGVHCACQGVVVGDAVGRAGAANAMAVKPSRLMSIGK